MPNFLNILPSQYNPPMAPIGFPNGSGPQCNPCSGYNPVTPENNPCSGQVNPTMYSTNPIMQPYRPVQYAPAMNPITPFPVRPIVGQPIWPQYPQNPSPFPCRPTTFMPEPVMPMPIRAQPIQPIDMRPPEPCGGVSPFPLLNPTQQYVPWNNSGASKLPFINMMASGFPLPQVSNLVTNPIPPATYQPNTVLVLRRNIFEPSEYCPLPVAA